MLTHEIREQRLIQGFIQGFRDIDGSKKDIRKRKMKREEITQIERNTKLKELKETQIGFTKVNGFVIV